MKCCNNCNKSKCSFLMHGITPDGYDCSVVCPENWDCETDYCSKWESKEPEEIIENIFKKMDKDLETLTKVFKDFGETLTKFAKESNKES